MSVKRNPDSGMHKVLVALDRDSGIWFIKESSVKGLHIESDDYDQLVDDIGAAVTDLQKMNNETRRDKCVVYMSQGAVSSFRREVALG